MKKHLLLLGLLITIGYYPATAQQNTPYNDQVTREEGVAFLPFRRGEVIRKITGANNNPPAQCFPVFANFREFNPPQGFRLTVFGNDSYMELLAEPYIKEGQEVFTKGGSSLTLNFNDPNKLFHLSVVDDIYPKPIVVAEFYGHPVYFNGQYETTVIANNRGPLFRQVTKQQYLEALIEDAERKQRSTPPVSHDENIKEMEKAYRLLLETDRAAAAEFKQSMDDYIASLGEEQPAADLVTMLSNELNGLSPAELKEYAYYDIGAMERYGNFSGLVPNSEKDNATALVRPYYWLVEKNNSNIQLIILRWNLSTTEHDPSAPRLYTSQKRSGYALTDQRMAELYHTAEIWKSIFNMVR